MSHKKIPEPLYPCKFCSDERSWSAEDLYWSELDEGWVCEVCWEYRDSVWDGLNFIDEKKGVSIADLKETIRTLGKKKE